MEWYHAYGVVAGTLSLALVAVLVANDYRKARRERELHKGAIKSAICDAEAVMRNVSCLSRDYDFADEKEVSERIAEYARKNMPKIGRCTEEIRAHGMRLGSGDPLAKRAKGVVETLEWFADFYGSDGSGPSMKQRVVWNEDRDEIGDGIDRLLRTAERM